MCNRRFDSEEKLKIHHKGQHEGRLRQYQCGDCPKAFMTMQHLKSHVLTHNKEKKFTCGICSHRFLVASNLRRHMKNRHTNNKTFKCDKCPKEYKYRYVLQLHMKNKHNLEEKEENVESADQNQPIVKKEEVLFKERQTEFVCYVCGKVFSKKYFLQNHLLIHSGAKPYTCEVCNKSFRQKGHLQRHQKIHSGERNYQCCYCSKRFTRQEHLTAHEKSLHQPSGMKEVSLSICKICNRSFKTRCLKKHMKTHEPKQYQCSDCGGDFGTEAAFKNHIIEGYHFLEPVKTCPVCFKEFSKAAHVRRHMINVHAAKSFRCTVCGEGYLNEEEFQKHVVKGHGLVGQTKKRQKKKVEKVKSEDEEDQDSLDVLDLLY
jgi:KRAB domain-containing zinc finger protein